MFSSNIQIFFPLFLSMSLTMIARKLLHRRRVTERQKRSDKIEVMKCDDFHTYIPYPVPPSNQFPIIMCRYASGDKENVCRRRCLHTRYFRVQPSSMCVWTRPFCFHKSFSFSFSLCHFLLIQHTITSDGWLIIASHWLCDVVSWNLGMCDKKMRRKAHGTA